MVLTSCVRSLGCCAVETLMKLPVPGALKWSAKANPQDQGEPPTMALPYPSCLCQAVALRTEPSGFPRREMARVCASDGKAVAGAPAQLQLSTVAGGHVAGARSQSCSNHS
eukprot:s352_g31.t1